MRDKLVSLYLNLEDTSFSMAKFEVVAALLGDTIVNITHFWYEIDESSNN